MLEHEPLEIVLVEDNLADAELALHALKKSRVAGHMLHARDGAEAVPQLGMYWLLMNSKPLAAAFQNA